MVSTPEPGESADQSSTTMPDCTFSLRVSGALKVDGGMTAIEDVLKVAPVVEA